jgi:alkylation response protein AidB-like acyl-CoA dehydrogenase
VDLQLTDEQTWLAESLETLLAREGDPWQRLVEFGALDVGGDEGLGAVELCLIARGLGAHLASTPYLGSAALRYAAPSLLDTWESVAIALLEPGSNWSIDVVQAEWVDGALRGRKVAVEHGGAVDRLAVVALVDGEPGVMLASGGEVTAQPSFDPSLPMAAIDLDGIEVDAQAVLGGETGSAAAARLSVVGGLLASAEAVGAAGHILADARQYAAERRQFGRTIGSNQALRHLLADMYVRHASAWSTVLYAAAALDDGVDDPELTASVAKAYVARAAREVAHGAMQVFGGIAFTEEHQAHRYLRRIVVREQQFGDAAHHERELGRRLAARAVAPASVR